MALSAFFLPAFVPSPALGQVRLRAGAASSSSCGQRGLLQLLATDVASAPGQMVPGLPRNSKNLRTLRNALGFRKPPPPPPSLLWQQPAAVAAFVVGVVSVLLVGLLVRSKSRIFRKKDRVDSMALGDMYFTLEKSALVREGSARAPAPPPAARPMPITLPMPTATRTPFQAAPPPTAPTTPTVPASASTASAPSAPLPTVSTAAPTAPLAEEKSKSGFGWLRGKEKTKAHNLEELLEGEAAEARADIKFARALASEMVVDLPEGVVGKLSSLKYPPASIPKGTRVALLHSAVKAEAESISQLNRSKAIISVTMSLLAGLVDHAASKKDKAECTATLDSVVAFANEADSLCAEFAPDVEAERAVYAGELRYSKLEELYSKYLESVVQQQFASVLSTMMSGGEDTTNADERMEVLASVFGISEGKSKKLLDKATAVAQQQAQAEMLAGLQNLGKE